MFNNIENKNTYVIDKDYARVIAFIFKKLSEQSKDQACEMEKLLNVYLLVLKI
ncbi:hypothetical protein HMPREF0793_0648 [Staphylococcus caprae M23864:W1]|uniref:Uncharacterized protein n=1 Tax=Staphylococcus caprae TaxID=29380 RepID=A0ABM7FQU7_9STAP|nr:hypothetical protein HMPREF0793_0648 [Staphylococcus caprae M23864:W1]BBD89056.1 hypothetical protein JMUB145_0435 [Staphylococcus caprae]BBD91528.1 hypothetical protein JMUB590_0418 [Staphylococcus caprae]BBD94031.1 hypothetical protein JMUB898_0411 [Staphylococcus caprae]